MSVGGPVAQTAPTGREIRPDRRTSGGSARSRDDQRTGLLLLTPTVVIVLVMVILPILWTFSLASPGVTPCPPPRW